MALSVRSLLLDFGPSRSSAIVERLIAKGVRPAAARQQLSRAKPPVLRLRGHTLPNREAFFFLPDQFQNGEFKERLCTALRDTRSAYGRALIGLQARGGAIDAKMFSVASGQPMANTRGQLLHSKVEKNSLNSS